RIMARIGAAVAPTPSFRTRGGGLTQESSLRFQQNIARKLAEGVPALARHEDASDLHPDLQRTGQRDGPMEPFGFVVNVPDLFRLPAMLFEEAEPVRRL